MRRLEKITLSLAVLFALSAPAAAQAELSNWEHEGVPLESSVAIPFGGDFNFPGAAYCFVAATAITLQPGSTGELSSFSVPSPSTNCEVRSLLKSVGCTEVTGVTAENLPWSLHNTSTEAKVTNVKTTAHFKGGMFCPKSFTATGEAALTPDNREAIGSFTLHGVLTTSLGTSITLSNLITPTNPSDKGTYGL